MHVCTTVAATAGAGAMGTAVVGAVAARGLLHGPPPPFLQQQQQQWWQQQQGV